MNNEAAYWIALAHLPRWGHLKINNLIIKFFHENKITIEEFFQLNESDWRNQYQLDEKQVLDLKQAKAELASNAFLAESYFSQGFEIIPITSPEYSRTLKDNLKIPYAPAVLYVKGNKKILEEKSIAIVGSRDASENALRFTDNIAKLASKEYKVVVSGFAKGVDKQALDSAINYKGQSVIVLPQGIMTFSSGFKNYYKQIIDGDVLVLSTFFPKAPWKTELAMARNPIIYGLADEIYVAESAEKGGTWSGVVDGLRKGRTIFVRKPEPNEKNANQKLLELGAVAVQMDGQNVELTIDCRSEIPKNSIINDVKEPENHYENRNIEKEILEFLQNGYYTPKEIILGLKLDWEIKKLSNYLKNNPNIKKSDGKPTKYTRTETISPTLFG
jgi:DNA processing protein